MILSEIYGLFHEIITKCFKKYLLWILIIKLLDVIIINLGVIIINLLDLDSIWIADPVVSNENKIKQTKEERYYLFKDFNRKTKNKTKQKKPSMV